MDDERRVDRVLVPDDADTRLLIELSHYRTFFPSKVRTAITSFVQVPAELSATHDLVARFRNRTIAHSQSDLSVTYPIDILDAKKLNVLDVSAPTVCSTTRTERVNSLITVIDELVLAREIVEDLPPAHAELEAGAAALEAAAGGQS